MIKIYYCKGGIQAGYSTRHDKNYVRTPDHDFSYVNFLNFKIEKHKIIDSKYEIFFPYLMKVKWTPRDRWTAEQSMQRNTP